MATAISATSTCAAFPTHSSDVLPMKAIPKSSVDSQPPDSGYSSPAQKRPTKRTINTGARSPPTSYPFSLSHETDTHVFKREIGVSSIARYNEILPELERLLLSKFKSSGRIFSQRRRFRPMSIRLTVIGKTEADAKECVVVFCDQPMCKSVEQYLKKDNLIKQLFEPIDTTTPFLDLVVKGHAPKLRSMSPEFNVHCSSMDLSVATFCGLSIRFINCDEVVQCGGTFGGVVKVMPMDGEVLLLGMTAAHTLRDWSDSNSDPADDLELNDIHDPEEFAHHSGSTSPSLAQASQQGAPFAKPLGDFDEPFELGKVTAEAGGDESVEEPYLDWALFNLNDVRPNHLPNSTRKEPFSAAFMISSSDHDFPAVMIGQSQDCKSGKVSRIPARIMLGIGDSFTDAFLLTLDEGTVVDGQSGAWVVNPTTFEVYGHVVATDMFDEVYVIPMQKTLTDIKRVMGAKSVELPTDLDFIPPQKRLTLIDAAENCQAETLTTPQAVTTARSQDTDRKKRALEQENVSESVNPGHDGDDQEKRAGKRTRLTQCPTLKLACPFYKRDPAKYKGRQACTGPGWSSISRLKEHIYRAHRQPDNKCNRCCEVFLSGDQLEDHQRAEYPCQVSQDKSIDGINESQYIALRKKPVGKKGDVERWEEVYRTIFPQATVIPSAYYDYEDSNRIATVNYDSMKALEEELIAGVRNDLEDQFDQFAEEQRRGLVKIVEDRFKRIIEQWTDNNPNIEPRAMPLEAAQVPSLPNFDDFDFDSILNGPDLDFNCELLPIETATGDFYLPSDPSNSAYVSMEIPKSPQNNGDLLDTSSIPDSETSSTRTVRPSIEETQGVREVLETSSNPPIPEALPTLDREPKAVHEEVEASATLPRSPIRQTPQLKGREARERTATPFNFSVSRNRCSPALAALDWRSVAPIVSNVVQEFSHVLKPGGSAAISSFNCFQALSRSVSEDVCMG